MRFAALLALVACVDAPPVEDEEVAAACATDDCVHDGDYLFTGSPDPRRVVASLPPEVDGAPVLFLWHHLGGSPEEILSWLPVDGLVDDGFVVVTPASRGVWGSEWAVTGDPEDNPDVALFDALLDDLLAQGADPDRVYATGFSAGGLFTTYLTMHRGDRLAATAPFSGGAPPEHYVAPASDLPVMVSWGGPTDSYAGFDFDAASENLVESLVADGHVVLACEHDLGHWLPLDATSRTKTFFRTLAEEGVVPDFPACERR